MDSCFTPGTQVRIVRCGCHGAQVKLGSAGHAGYDAIVNCDVPARQAPQLEMPRLILCTILPARNSGCVALEVAALA